MRIIIDIPEQFESDYKGDMFKDFFSRVLYDIQDGTLCGNYEEETAEMLLKAFDESIPMDRIVEQLEENSYIETVSDLDPYWDIPTKVVRLERAIDLVKAGGKV